MFKSRNEYLNILDEFSSQFENDNFLLWDVNWWPVIKIHVAFKLHQLMTIDSHPVLANPKSLRIVLKRYSIKSRLIARMRRKFDKREAFKVAVFTSGRNTTTKFIDGTLINQFTYPFLTYFDKEKIDYKVINTVNNPVTAIGRIIYQNRVVDQYNNHFDFQKQIKRIESFLTSRLGSALPDTYQSISKTIIEHQIDYLSYVDFLKKNEFKHILFYCYYGENISPLLRAANNFNISTIEYQHSLVSEDHFAYTRWNAKSLNYRYFFPKKVWSWSSDDVVFLNKSFGWLPDFKAINGGNIYYSLIRNTIAKQMKTGKKVLVTLQGIGIPDFVKKFIAEHKDVFWYLRLHPRYPNDVAEVKSLHVLNPDNTDMDLSNKLSLYELLAGVDYHMTCFSGSALEAELAGIKNIIYGNDGARSYKAKINSGLYDFVDNERSLELSLNHTDSITQSGDSIQPVNTEELIKSVFS